MRKIIIVSALALITTSSAVSQQTRLELEAGPAWQSKNNVQIPNDSAGDRFSLSDLSNGPELATRVTAEHTFSQRHTVRAIFAPLTFQQTGEFTTPVNFDGESFAANERTSTSYRFNSYRLGYRYSFIPEGPFQLRAGGTIKVRDARVRLSQEGRSKSYANVGVVPLLSAQALYAPTENLSLLLDIEGLGASQGRAIDALIGARYNIDEQFDLTLGYRMLEGGADNDEVYTFSWIHYAVVGLGYRF
jgi:hypothetical protein